MVEAFTSRSGDPSVRVNGIALHSPYDPAREASRFLETRRPEGIPSTVVILGEGLGYLARAASERYPAARIVRIHYSPDLLSLASGPGAVWHPGSPRGLKSFLRSTLDELDIEGLLVVEWPPSAQAFAKVSRTANEAVRQLAMEMNGSLVTTLSMGRLWIRNAAANFLALSQVAAGRLCAADRPVLIAASGPTLERAAAHVKRIRGSIDVWALPSAMGCLASAGVKPDLIVLTDPGPYTLHHLRYVGSGVPIAMPLSAARGLWDLEGDPCLPPRLVAQPGPLEQPLLDRAGVSAPLVPPHGTVTATAVELALASTRAPVIVAGLDLCLRDIQPHARPAAFDLLLHAGSSRLHPHYAQTYERARAQGAERLSGGTGPRVPLALRTYAGWFSDLPLAGRAFRLLPSAVGIPGMPEVETGDLGRLVGGWSSVGGATLSPDPGFPGLTRRRQILEEVLIEWQQDLERAAADVRERAQEGIAALFRSPRLSLLLLNLDGQALLEVRRRKRLGKDREAADVAVAMLDRSSVFVRCLRERTQATATVERGRPELRDSL